ncbi:MAG: channel protein TolC, partial [Gammaproteobacteria bacterium]
MNKFTYLIVFLGLFCLIGPSFAADLLEVYESAAAHDPTYKRAAATRLAAQEAKPQSIAGLLPIVDGSVSTTGSR